MGDKYPNRLRELRERRIVDDRVTSVRDVARDLNLTYVTVSRHETGERQPDGFQIERYARYYGVSPYELFVPPGYYLIYDEDHRPVPSIEDDVKAIIARMNLDQL